MSEEYCKHLELPDGTPVLLCLMGPGDEEKVRQFFRGLPVQDRDFLKYDVTQPEVFEMLQHSASPLGYDRAKLVLAEIDAQVAGVGFLRRHNPHWSDHVGEIWLLVGQGFRRRGLGRLLAREIFSLAVDEGLEKIIAEMASDHTGAIEVFQHLGFTQEGRLTNYVKGKNGKKRDLVVMAYDVEDFLSKVQYLGLPEAFGEEWPAPR